MKTMKNCGLEVYYREGSVDERMLNEASFEKDMYLLNVPEYVLTKDTTVIDVGAHIGAFSLLVGKKAPQGKVWAIEACKETFDILQKNTEVNSLANVLPYHMALAKENGTVKLYHNARSGNWGHSITTEVSDSFEETKSVTLEHFFNEQNIENLDLLKSNCEGAEFEILMSTPVEVLKRIDLIIALYHIDLSADHSLQELIDHLEQAGFEIVIRNESKKIRGWLIAKNKQGFKNAPVSKKVHRIVQHTHFALRRSVKFVRGCFNGMLVRLKLKK